jgi:hypothetical protein
MAHFPGGGSALSGSTVATVNSEERNERKSTSFVHQLNGYLMSTERVRLRYFLNELHTREDESIESQQKLIQGQLWRPGIIMMRENVVKRLALGRFLAGVVCLLRGHTC